jgi:predicted nuclease of predicted toxin-antitoxin system
VKFLIDNQLPQALAKHLSARQHDCEHVLDVGLANAPDAAISLYAISQERILVSKDEDFVYLLGRLDSAMRLIWVRTGNCRTKTLLAAFDRSWLAIESCFAAGDRLIEIR